MNSGFKFFTDLKTSEMKDEFHGPDYTGSFPKELRSCYWNYI